MVRLTIFLLLTAFLSFQAKASDLVVKTSNLPPKVIEKRLLAILKAKHVKIFAVIDHQKAAKDAGFNIPYEKVFIFGKPKVGTILIKENPKVGLELPLKLLVYEKNGKSFVVYKDPVSLTNEFNLRGKTQILNKLSVILDKITDKIIKERE